jgi:hypothetical protein
MPTNQDNSGPGGTCLRYEDEGFIPEKLHLISFSKLTGSAWLLYVASRTKVVVILPLSDENQHQAGGGPVSEGPGNYAIQRVTKINNRARDPGRGPVSESIIHLGYQTSFCQSMLNEFFNSLPAPSAWVLSSESLACIEGVVNTTQLNCW